MLPDSKKFESIPATQIGDYVSLQVGIKVSLVMLHHTPAGAGVLFPVEFIPSELEYRTPGQKDAVLHGRARLVDSQDNFQPARVLFSQYHKTASLKGLAVEGEVKLAP